MHTTIYFDYVLSPRLGGPPGYLWNLSQALAAHAPDPARFGFVTQGMVNDVPRPAAPVALPRWNVLARLQQEMKRRRKATRRAERDALWLDGLAGDGAYDSPLLAQIPYAETAIIHAHTTIDAAKVIRATRHLPRRPLVALTSHCPEAPSREWTAVKAAEGARPPALETYRAAYDRVDRFAFENADCLVFPCRDAMEPYLETMPGFDAIAARRPLHFLPTGIEGLTVGRPPAEVRAQYGIPATAKVVGFIGRHSTIKGYDLLARDLLPLLERRPDLHVLVAGKEGPLPTPRHPRWHEIGWTTSPGDLINAFDVFVLPNRETYFDLVALEVLSVGTPLLASDRGGNRFLGGVSAGVQLFPLAGGLAGPLAALLDAPAEVRADARQANRRAFEAHFSLPRFAAGYVRLTEEIAAARDLSA